jgi:hypothetical protein
MKKKTLLFLLILFIILIFFTVLFYFYEIKFFRSSANVIQQDYSPDNSYVFSTPLRAKADGSEKIRTTVFILNNQGLGVEKMTVLFNNTSNLSITVVQGITDSFGKAIFDISSTSAGDYYLEFSVNNSPLKQRAHLNFY